jgi:hypothetical protein
LKSTKEEEDKEEEKEKEEKKKKRLSDQGDNRHLEKPYAHWHKPHHSNVSLSNV